MSSSITYAASLENPLNFNTIQGFLQGVLGALMYLGLPLIALIIIYSGFLFVRAQGNSEQLQVAKKNFFYVIIGTGLFLGAWALTQIVAATISSLTSQV
jgi:predicted transporter